MRHSTNGPAGRQPIRPWSFTLPHHILPVYATYRYRNGRQVTTALCGADSFEGSGHYNVLTILQGVPVSRVCGDCKERFNAAMAQASGPRRILA